MNADYFLEHPIYVTKHGSHAYGLNTPTSDLDIKGIFIADSIHYHGFVNTIAQIERKDPNDLVYFELRKFFKLAADCNPNIIEVLFTDDSDIISINKYGEKLREHKNLFL